MEVKTISLKKLDKEIDGKKISQALHDVWGVRQVEVQVDKGEATVSYDEKAASFIDFQQAIVDIGYEVENEEDGNIKQ
jgi:copper chaperone